MPEASAGVFRSTKRLCRNVEDAFVAPNLLERTAEGDCRLPSQRRVRIRDALRERTERSRRTTARGRADRVSPQDRFRGELFEVRPWDLDLEMPECHERGELHHPVLALEELLQRAARKLP